MSTIDLIEDQYEALMAEYEKFAEKGNNAAGTRARKSAMELTKLMKVLRTEIQTAKNAGKS